MTHSVDCVASAPHPPYLEAPSRSYFTQLPQSLLAHITSDLSRPEGIALACSSPALRQAGEACAWRTLNITLQRQFLPCHTVDPTSRESAQPLGALALYEIRERFTWGVSDPRILNELMGRYLSRLVQTLRKRDRYRAVREIHFDLDLLFSSRFADLLSLVQYTLKKLIFHPMGYQARSSPSAFNLLTVGSEFATKHLQLPALTRLTLPLGEEWADDLRRVLGCTPNLKHLTLGSMIPYAGSWDDPLIFPLAPPNLDWPILEWLETLEVQEMDDAFLPFLICLIDHAPLLTRVGLRDPGRTWTGRGGVAEDLLDALRGVKMLKYLGVPPCLTDKLAGGRGFEEVEEVSLMRDERKGYGFAWTERLTIPPLPSFRRLFSHSSTCTAHSLTYAWTNAPLGLPRPIQGIPAHIISQILAAPNLTSIHLVSSPSQENYLDPSNLIAEGEGEGRTILIRSYHSPLGEVFTHARSYTPHHSQVEGGVVLRSKAVWEEFVDFDGERLDGKVLGGLYGWIGGERGAGWTVPGRGLTMAEEGWELLRGWKAKISRRVRAKAHIVLEGSECGAHESDAPDALGREVELMRHWDGPDLIDL